MKINREAEGNGRAPLARPVNLSPFARVLRTFITFPATPDTRNRAAVVSGRIVIKSRAIHAIDLRRGTELFNGISSSFRRTFPRALPLDVLLLLLLLLLPHATPVALSYYGEYR